MVNFNTDYKIIAKIYESPRSLVYRAHHHDHQPVILKILKEDYPTPSELTRYKQEYEITHSLQLDGVVKAYGLQKYQNTLVMLLEDFGGESLEKISNSKKFTILEFLVLAIKVTEILGGIHAANIIHKDINPSNIVVNQETRQIKIIDFGLSTVFSRENPTIKNPQILEGTLAYMSPEQTGRMNRLLDYTTDFYSLGATFYKLLTNRLLFETTDALELVHCHIAKQPIPPHQIDPAIPQAVSAIILKLLAKTAEERYQSAWGLKADLEECLTQLQTTGNISDFPLARQDFSEKFQIPQKLYGREREIETLMAAFNRAALAATEAQTKTEMILVAGYSGIGKSVLVQELYKPITQRRGYFTSGKFDQFQRNIPYSAVVHAFQALVKQLLTESEEQLTNWRNKLLAAFGPNGQIIIDVIPEVEQIVGSQPSVQQLEPTEAQNRFNLVFQNFIRALCQRAHPLVVFLDDLQWADAASLKLIELMMTDEQIQYFLLIGSYRDNEVNPNHPLMITLDQLAKEGAVVNKITLEPLKLNQITQLIADTLHRDFELIQPLAELVFQKTSGNPFFINEFLKAVYQEGLLTFDRNHKCWQWDITQIEALGITDNVVDLMIGKLKKLPDQTQQALRLAACVGSHFDLKTLCVIYERSSIETFSDLLPAIQLGLLQPTSDLEMTSAEVMNSSLVVSNYKFLHDRVQQAAYALIDEDQKKMIHLKIGRLLLANTNMEEREDKIFALVEHFNKGQDLLLDISARIELAKLNLTAGKKARDAIAYAAARQYLRSAIKNLPENMWLDYYDIALKIHKELAEIEYLNGNFEQSQVLINLALRQAEMDLEKVDLYALLIGQYTLQGQYLEAIQAGQIALNLMGITLPEKEFQAFLETELAEVEKNLRGRKALELINSSEMKIQEKKATLQLLAKLVAPAFIAKQELVPVLIVISVNLSIKYGYTIKFLYTYSFYGGLILGNILKNYHAGYEFGLLGLELSKKLNDLSSKVVATQVLANFLTPWLKHIKISESLNYEGYDAGLQSGDLHSTGYSLTYNVFNLVYQGKHLEYILQEASKFLLFSQKTKNQWAHDCILGCKILLLNLLGMTQGGLDFNINDISELVYLGKCNQNQNAAAICFYYIFKAQVMYLYSNLTEALICIEQAKHLSNFIQGTISIANLNFYHSLILCRLYLQVTTEKQKEYIKQLEANQKQMRLWADNCQENFLHKYLLVAAEIAHISGDWQEAMDLYDQAIESAREHEFIQNEALANELAAKFWLTKGKEQFAQLYLRKARQNYQIWGAKRKVEALDEQYSHWLTATGFGVKSASIDTLTTTSNSLSTSSTALDLSTVLKASQTISGEILLDKLLKKLMNIVIENAGAQKGFLILGQEENWVIEAEGTIDTDDVKVLQSIPVDFVSSDSQLPLLAIAIINYVARTQENVVLNDATNEGPFTCDPYVIASQSKSILCTPLLNKGHLSGILYLENNLTTNAFTPERVEVLRILSAQVAISIENSRFYEQLEDYSRTLEQKVKSRTQELEDKNQELANLLQKLKATQAQIIAQEKLASLGSLTAGIAHEIKNPLNFVNNFAELSVELAQELLAELENHKDRIDAEAREYIEEILNDLRQNTQKINEHGKRADSIVQGMLMHSRGQSGQRQLTDVNALLAEAVSLAYHGMRAKDAAFNITIESHYDRSLSPVNLIPQNISRAFINIINNACYVVHKKRLRYQTEILSQEQGFSPKLVVSTQSLDNSVEIRIRDNGEGIPQETLDKMFHPFFTTKPPGEGTGLGLSISHDIIVQQHQGDIRVETEIGQYAEFIITLPKNSF